MNDFFKIIIAMVVICLYCYLLYLILQIVEIFDLRKKIKCYNKRFNANLDTSFSDLKRLRVQYNDWYVSMFVPDDDTKMSHWERVCEEWSEYHE